MTASTFDFAIFGNEPLAWLLAGLLVARHRRTVLLVPGQATSFGLQRSFDLSIGPVTRPETWSLLRTNGPETVKLLTSIGGRSVVQRLSAIFVAETAAGKQALSHIEQMARAFDHEVERLGEVTGRAATRFIDAVLIDRPALAPTLQRWTLTAGVELASGDLALSDLLNGRAISAGRPIAASRLVLVGSRAILEHGLALPPILRTATATAILTEPNRAMRSRYMHQIDSGVTLTQPLSMAVAGVSPGALPDALPRIARLLTDHGQLRLAGRSEFGRLITTDGAGYFGKVEAGPDLILTNDATAAFLAPALARWLAGSPTPAEAAYFDRRGVRAPSDSAVAEFSAEGA